MKRLASLAAALFVVAVTLTQAPSARADADQGAWGAPFDLPVLGISSVVLPTGNVLIWAYPEGWRRNDADAYEWDPRKGTGPDAFVRVTPPISSATGMPENIWCGGQSLLPNGHVLVTGGNADDVSLGKWRGTRTVLTYDPWRREWTRHADMRQGRWYPTQTLMADGRTLIQSGYDGEGAPGGGERLNPDLEIANGLGDVTMLAADLINTPVGPATSQHTYPHAAVLPDGQVATIGAVPGDEFAVTIRGDHVTWTDLPDQRHAGAYANMVLLPDAPWEDEARRLMKIGGAYPGRRDPPDRDLGSGDP